GSALSARSMVIDEVVKLALEACRIMVTAIRMRIELPDARLAFAVVMMMTSLALCSDAALPPSGEATAFTYDPAVSRASSILAYAPVLDNSESSANLAAAALQANM